MTDRIEKLAASDAEMPDDLSMPEQLLFLTLRTLYQNFRNGSVNRDRAKREKSRIYVAYSTLAREYQVVEFQKAVQKRLEQNIGMLHSCGCPNCITLINIFTGVDRQDIPTDVRELHSQNERLRDMVKVRSERNAELATTIDKVRWTLESDRTDTEKLERIREIVSR